METWLQAAVSNEFLCFGTLGILSNKLCCLIQKNHAACAVSTVTATFFAGSLGGWWRWALVGLDGVAPSRMVGVSASVNLPLRHKVQKFLFWHRLTRVVQEKGP